MSQMVCCAHAHHPQVSIWAHLSRLNTMCCTRGVVFSSCILLLFSREVLAACVVCRIPSLYASVAADNLRGPTKSNKPVGSVGRSYSSADGVRGVRCQKALQLIMLIALQSLGYSCDAAQYPSMLALSRRQQQWCFVTAQDLTALIGLATTCLGS